MNFNIVSAPDKRLTAEQYPQFKEDYLNSELDYFQLKSKYGLSKKEYGETAKKVREEENIDYRPRANARHFYQNGSKWRIVKSINGENILFGSLPISSYPEEKMKIVIEKCKKLRWDYEKCTRYIKSLPH